MPELGATIGGVIYVRPDYFLWAIPGFSELSRQAGVPWFLSPPIYVGETRWWLFILPNGTTGLSDNMVLGLARYDLGPVKTFECSVDIRREDGEDEPLGRETSKLGIEYICQVLYSSCKRARECVEGEYLSSDALTVALSLREIVDVIRPDQTDQETQTEDLEGMTDYESPEAKGMKLLTKNMIELFIKSHDCDIRFHVQGREFPAHRNILKARCPVFSMMLTHDMQEKRSGIIRIEDCDADAFEIFLLYLYSGKLVDFTTNKALDLYYIGEKYDFPALKEQCVNFLQKSLSKSTVYDVILLSAMHNEMDLMEAAAEFFMENVDEIIVTGEWQNFMREHPVEANQVYIKYVNMSRNKRSVHHGRK